MSATEKNKAEGFNNDPKTFAKSTNSAKPAPQRTENKCIQCLAARPKWFWIIIIGVLGCIVAGGVAATLIALLYNPMPATLTSYPTNSTVGKPCTASADCILNAYCSIASGQSTGSCVCTTTFYFDPASSSCLARKTVNVPCTYNYECLEYKRLTCISGTCQCDSNTKFWNTTVLECQYIKVPFTLCSSSSECAFSPNSACQSPAPINSMGYNRCACSGNWWYNPYTGVCETKKLVGVGCNYDYECISFAYCAAPAGSTNKVCVCDTYYYNNNGYCTLKQTSLNSGCSFVDQCNINQNNMRCISGLCRCDLVAEVWDSFYLLCVSLKTYGQSCTSNSDCVSGFSCLVPAYGGIRKACICSSTQYFDWITGTCLTTKSYNSICSSRYECNNQDTMVCVTSGGVTKRCLCAPNYSYQSGTTCVLKKTFGTGCSADVECQDYLGFYCSGTCQCPSTKMYDSTYKKCVPRKRKGDYCTSAGECSSSVCSGSICQ